MRLTLKCEMMKAWQHFFNSLWIYWSQDPASSWEPTQGLDFITTPIGCRHLPFFYWQCGNNIAASLFGLSLPNKAQKLSQPFPLFHNEDVMTRIFYCYGL